MVCQALPSNDMIVVLDFALTERLVQEGKARDVVRVVQQARREAGFHVSDRIRLSLSVPEDWRGAIEAFLDYVRDNTLAVELDLEGRLDGLEGESVHRHEARLGEEAIVVALARL